MAIEIVSFPIIKTVDLSMVFCMFTRGYWKGTSQKKMPRLAIRPLLGGGQLLHLLQELDPHLELPRAGQGAAYFSPEISRPGKLTYIAIENGDL